MSDPHDPNVTSDLPPTSAPQDPNVTADIPASSVPPDSLDAGLAAGFGQPIAPRSSLGALRPVLLKEAEGESDHVVKPQSDAMPPKDETGDRYRLDGEIARGGMGAVLRGRDVDLGRDLAVKVLLEKYANRPEVARRFVEEAQIGGQLQHPGVVPVYDIGRFGDRPFFTMKLVKGDTLAQILSERQHPTDDLPKLLGIALRVSEALAYAHAKGVIHRDLKPANIMVGAFGEVQVMDWGLAKVLAEGGIVDEERASRAHQEPEDETTVRTARSTGTAGSYGTETQAGSMLGTPAYMPPEQANGDIANLNRRADVFGLGAILCEILTGKPPYVGRSGEEVRRKAANGDLADATARLDGCGADAELIALTKRCLSAEAGDRPKDAREVTDGLSAYLNGVQERLQVAQRERAVAVAREVEQRKRRKVQLTLSTAVLLVLVGGVAVSAFFAVEADTNATTAEANAREANEYAKESSANAERATTKANELKAALVDLGNEKAQVERQKDEIQKQLNNARFVAYASRLREAQIEIERHRPADAENVLRVLRQNSPDLTGWEYAYLLRQTQKCLWTSGKQTGEINSVAYSPDGKRMVAGIRARRRGGKGGLKVWDTGTGQEVLALQTGSVTSVAYSPDGKTVVSSSNSFVAGGSPEVKVWDATTGEEKLTLKGHTASVTGVGYSPDGNRIVSGSLGSLTKDKVLRSEIKVWDAATGKELLPLTTQKNRVTGVAFSPDGKRIVSSTDTVSGGIGRGEILVWDSGTGRELLALKGKGESPITGVAFSPDGKRIVSSHHDGMVRVWDADTGQEQLHLKHFLSVSCAGFSRDGKRIVSATHKSVLGTGSIITVWDAITGQEVLTLEGHTDIVDSVAFSPDGKRIVSGSRDGTVKVWDATESAALTLEHPTNVTRAAFSPDGKRIVSGMSVARTVKVWDVDTVQELLTFKEHKGYINSVAFSPDGKRIVSTAGQIAFRDQPAVVEMKVWDAATGQVVLDLEGHTAIVTSVAFNNDGTRIVSGSYDKTLKVWDAQTGKEILTIVGHTDRVSAVSFSPDGKRILSGSADKTARVWDAGNGQEVLTLKGHTGSVNSAAFNNDGSRIVSGGGNFDNRGGQIKVWDAGTGQEHLSLRGHTDMVSSVAFSPDGQRIVSGSSDQTVKVWDAATGQEALTLRGHIQSVAGVGFSPDGNRIVSCSNDHTVKVWDASPGATAGRPAPLPRQEQK